MALTLYFKEMVTFFSKSSILKNLPLETYSVELPLDKLVPGVDNIHYDVYLSPSLCTSANKIIRRLLIYTTVFKFHRDEKNLSVKFLRNILESLSQLGPQGFAAGWDGRKNDDSASDASGGRYRLPPQIQYFLTDFFQGINRLLPMISADRHQHLAGALA